MLKYFTIISLIAMGPVHALEKMADLKEKCPKEIGRLSLEHVIGRGLESVQMVGQDNIQRSFHLDLESAKDALRQGSFLKNDIKKVYPLKNATTLQGEKGALNLLCIYGKGHKMINLFLEVK